MAMAMTMHERVDHSDTQNTLPGDSHRSVQNQSAPKTNSIFLGNRKVVCTCVGSAVCASNVCGAFCN